MKGTGRTRGTGTGPVPTGPLSVNDAAELLGITPRAVRKRITAGTLYAQIIDGGYKVFPEFQPTKGTGSAPSSPEQFRSSTEPGNRAASSAVPPAQGPPQLAAIMQEWLAPLIHENGDLREQLGRERTLREQAEARAGELEQRLASRQERPTTPAAPPPPSPAQGHPDRVRSRVLPWLADQLA